MTEQKYKWKIPTFAEEMVQFQKDLCNNEQKRMDMTNTYVNRRQHGRLLCYERIIQVILGSLSEPKVAFYSEE